MRLTRGYWRLAGLLALSLLVAACGQAAQPTATATLAPTPVPPTATLMPDPTPAPPTATMTLPPTSPPEPTPLPEIDLNMELPEGDPARGRGRALSFGCMGCHQDATYAPVFEAAEGLPSMAERGEMRIADPAYEGQATTNREYILESILLPQVYIVPGEWGDPMPTTYAARMTDQELAQILAWLETLE